MSPQPSKSVVRAAFGRLRSRARLGIVLQGASGAIAAFAVFMLATLLIDRGLHLEVGYRLVVLVGFGVFTVRLLHRRMMRPLAVHLDDEEFALAVERSDPSVREQLISALQFEEALGGRGVVFDSPQLMRAVVDDVEARCERLGLERALDQRRIITAAAVLVLGLAVPAVWALVNPEALRLWAARNLTMSGEEWPRATHLQFAGVDASRVLRLPQGDDKTLVVVAAGVIPEQTVLHYEFDGGESGSESMTMTGDDEFSFTMQSVVDDVDVWATGGDGATAAVKIEIVERPRLDEVRLTVVHPPYMEQPDRDVSPGDGEVRLPRGGRLLVRGRSSKELASATLNLGDGQRMPMAIEDDHRGFSGSLEPDASGPLTLHVVDRDQLDTGAPPRFFLRVVEDAEPQLAFEPSGIGTMISNAAVIPGELTAADDYGLRTLRAEYQVTTPTEATEPRPDGAPAPQPPPVPWRPADVTGIGTLLPGAREFTADVGFDLLPLHPGSDPNAANSPVRPGQFVTLRFAATDNFGPGDPHLAYSEPAVFRIVTREDLLADLERRQGEQRRELEMIVTDEKTDAATLREIVSPTSNDPRAAAALGRVQAIARKQRGLGKRVQNVASQYRRILEELRNNRLLEPSDVADLTQLIVAPLLAVSKDDFPHSATAVKDFATTGKSDVRDVAVLSYESIIERLERVLQEMTEMENFATLLEDLRRVIKLQDAAIREAAKRRGADASSLFDAPPQADPKGKKSKDNK